MEETIQRLSDERLERTLTNKEIVRKEDLLQQKTQLKNQLAKVNELLAKFDEQPAEDPVQKHLYTTYTYTYYEKRKTQDTLYPL